MDKIWLDSGIDFRMKPYRVIATADQVGMIEIVLNSETISKIHHNAGTLGAFDHSSI
jgi:phosphatidylinositol-4,5-bisphosphate 3-kinase